MIWANNLCSTSSCMRLGLRCAGTAHPATVTRPPRYRKAHQHHTPKHVLQEEFMNAGDISGAGVRLFDYYKTAEMVAQLPTVKEKIDFVSPYERPWTKMEKTWRRDWHPSLMATRKAWSVPLSPAYFDCLPFYQYITNTRLITDDLDVYYKALVPPTAKYEEALIESLGAIMSSTRFDSRDDQVSAILGSIFDEALLSLAHNMSRLADYRIAYSVQNESFWIRAGFMSLYDEKELGSDEVLRKLNSTPKFIGDDRRKLGELAFVSRDKLAVQIRSKEAPAPLFALESEEAMKPLFESEVNLSEDVIFNPKVLNLWPDENPLWQCPGYFAETGETHLFGRVAAKSLVGLDDRCTYWGYNGKEREQVWEECARAQAVSTLFTTLNAQAHTNGFTQYTDITRPFTSQIVLSNGQDFVFAVGQLNTIAINIECDGFVNDKTNVCHVEPMMRLYDTIENGRFYYTSEDGVKEGLNPKVLQRILQMLMRD